MWCFADCPNWRVGEQRRSGRASRNGFGIGLLVAGSCGSGRVNRPGSGSKGCYGRRLKGRSGPDRPPADLRRFWPATGGPLGTFRYIDDVPVSATAEPSSDFIATGLPAFALTA